VFSRADGEPNGYVRCSGELLCAPLPVAGKRGLLVCACSCARAFRYAFRRVLTDLDRRLAAAAQCSSGHCLAYALALCLELLCLRAACVCVRACSLGKLQALACGLTQFVSGALCSTGALPGGAVQALRGLMSFPSRQQPAPGEGSAQA
jgi:hypothetical protein